MSDTENHNHNHHVSCSKIPVTILTGFLGAGKTTLLNHLLSGNTHKFAIIENELGAVGVDDALLKENVHDELVEVVNGCICCTVRGDLINALLKLHPRMQHMDGIIIETTGLADPAPVVQTFFMEEQIEQRFQLDAVLTVVDAKQILTRLDEVKPDNVANEALQQILFADKILLNKVDLVNSQELEHVRQRLAKLHPTVKIVDCQNGQVDPSELIGLKSFDLDRICALVPDFKDNEFLEFSEKHDTSVSSVAWQVEGELSMIMLQQWIERLIDDYGGERLYRYKGVLALKGQSRKYVFQGVGMLFAGVFGDDWGIEERVNRFVFIGKDLNAEFLRMGFDACTVTDQLRFSVGTIVKCNIGGQWLDGRVLAHWDEGHAYRVQLKDGEEIWAGLDIPEMIRASRSS